MDTAIVVLASWGDVIISTMIPRAIKEQRPDWTVTYYTTSACAGAIAGNPDVDHLVVLPGTKDQAWGMQDRVIADARRRHQKVIAPWAGWYQQSDWLPLTAPGWDGQPHHNFMWAYVRSAQHEGLEIALPPTIYLHLTDAERRRATDFVGGLGPRRQRILMEVEGHSSQSWLNESWLPVVMDVFDKIYGDGVELLISKGGAETPGIISAKQHWPGRVHLLNNYSLREVAWIFNSCDIFIGCSSGTSNACHAHCCKSDIKWFEAVRSTIWDSRPLRPNNKAIYYGASAPEFATMLSAGLS